MLPEQDLIERLGFFRIVYNLDAPHPNETFESLDSFFKYLLYSMPKEVYEKYKRNPRDSLFHFFQKCVYCQQQKMEKMFQFFRNSKSKLLQISAWLEFLHGSLKDELDANPKFNKVCISADRVPAIAVEDFSYIASEWVTGDCKWPSFSVVKEIVMSGCHIVPKPYYGKEGSNLLDWRWSFSVAEMILAQFRTRKMDTSYLILKSIFYKYLKPIECDNETLASYFVKTVMMWQCEENDETWWSDKTTVKCVSVLLNRLKVSFYKKHLPHYFIRELNLFDNMADELVLYGQAVLESICADPVICIEEVLKSYDIEETEMNQETILETDLEKDMPLLKAEIQEMFRLVEVDPPIEETEMNQETILETDLKKDMSLLKAEIQEMFSLVEVDPPIEETEMNQETILQTDLKKYRSLLKAEIQEMCRLVEEDFLLPQIFAKVVSEGVMPKLFSEGSFSEENYLQDTEKIFDDFIKAIESRLSNAFDIPLD